MNFYADLNKWADENKCSWVCSQKIFNNIRNKHHGINNNTKLKKLKGVNNKYYLWENHIDYKERLKKYNEERKRNQYITGHYKYSILIPIIAPYEKIKVRYIKEIPYPERNYEITYLEEATISFNNDKESIIFEYGYDKDNNTFFVNENVKFEHAYITKYINQKRESVLSEYYVWKNWPNNIFCDPGT